MHHTGCRLQDAPDEAAEETGVAAPPAHPVLLLQSSLGNVAVSRTPARQPVDAGVPPVAG